MVGTKHICGICGSKMELKNLLSREHPCGYYCPKCKYVT